MIDEKAAESSRESSSGSAAPRLDNKTEASEASRPHSFTPQRRLLILDIWERSEASAGDFSPLVGLSPHTLNAWRRRFEQDGPAGLLDGPRGAPRGSRVPEPTQRAILMLKPAHEDSTAAILGKYVTVAIVAIVAKLVTGLFAVETPGS